MPLRQRAEDGFERLGYWIVRRRWWVIALVVAVAAPLSSQAPNVTLDTSAEAFLREDDTAKQLYNEFRDEFGRGEFLVATIRTKDVLAPGFLAKLRDFHQALEEEVPHLEDVHSLVNARVTRGSQDELIVEDLLEQWPKDAQAWSDLRNYVLGHPLYADLLVSRDARVATVSIETSAYSSEGFEPELLLDAFDEEGTSPFLSGAENEEVASRMRRQTDRAVAWGQWL